MLWHKSNFRLFRFSRDLAGRSSRSFRVLKNDFRLFTWKLQILTSRDDNSIHLICLCTRATGKGNFSRLQLIISNKRHIWFWCWVVCGKRGVGQRSIFKPLRKYIERFSGIGSYLGEYYNQIWELAMSLKSAGIRERLLILKIKIGEL